MRVAIVVHYLIAQSLEGHVCKGGARELVSSMFVSREVSDPEIEYVTQRCTDALSLLLLLSRHGSEKSRTRLSRWWWSSCRCAVSNPEVGKRRLVQGPSSESQSPGPREAETGQSCFFTSRSNENNKEMVIIWTWIASQDVIESSRCRIKAFID